MISHFMRVKGLRVCRYFLGLTLHTKKTQMQCFFMTLSLDVWQIIQTRYTLSYITTKDINIEKLRDK